MNKRMIVSANVKQKTGDMVDLLEFLKHSRVVIRQIELLNKVELSQDQREVYLSAVRKIYDAAVRQMEGVAK